MDRREFVKSAGLGAAALGIAAISCGTPKMDWTDASNYVNIT